MRLTLSNYLYVPHSILKQEHCDAYTYRLVDPYTRQPYRLETYIDSIDGYYRFPRGDIPKLRRVFAGHEIVDERTVAPFKYRLRFTGELREEQARLINEWIACGYGAVQAPPRFGKTIVLCSVLCRLRQRTLMLAHIEDLCHQLEETIRRFTNINDLEQEHGKKLVGVLSEWTDFFPIATLSTYQCFAVSPVGRRELEKKRDYFGLVMVDEQHRCTTDLFREVVERTTAAYRCGVTATPTRKDGLHVAVSDTLGPVVAVGNAEQLNVSYSWEYTGVDVGNVVQWTTMINNLTKRKRRDQQIAAKIVEDVRAGHFVLATTERLQHLDSLQLAIQTIDPDITVGILSGSTKDREEFRADAKRGKYQVVIAMNKIVELGYNIPRWSCFHNTMPMANKQNWYQRISRIRTPMEPAFKGDDWQKPEPVARIWIDSGHPGIYAYKAIVKRENERLGFTCLTPEEERRVGKRKGLVTFEQPPPLPTEPPPWIPT